MKNIVVLDDSLTIHKIVEYSIDPDKYKLYKTFTVEDFNNKLKDIDIHLLLLDNKLDGINVKEFCKNLKRINKNIKIILLVGAFEKLDPKDFSILNIDDFINKPFNSKILSEKIESLMGGVPSYVEKGFNEMKGDLGKIDYERLLEELEPISAELNGELEEDVEDDEVINGEQVDEATFDELEHEEREEEREEEHVKNKKSSFEEKMLDFLEDDEDIKTMRRGYNTIEYAEELKASLERKLKEDIERIDFQKIGTPLIENYIIHNLEKIELEKYIVPLVEKAVNEVLMPKLEDMFQNILEKIITSLVPEIAERLIKEEIENIKKGKSE